MLQPEPTIARRLALILFVTLSGRSRAVWSATCRTLSFAVFLIAVLALHAQPGSDPGEFEKKIAAAPAAEKSPLLLALSNILDSVDTERAYAAAQRARQLATTPHDELLAGARISTLQRRRGDFAGALTTAQTGLTRAAELHDDPARAELLLAFARSNWSLADFPATIAAHQELVALAERLGNRALVARGHLGISVVYGEMKERAKARTEEELALGIAREIGDRELEADALNNLGNNYHNAGDFVRARDLHTEALAIRTAIGNRRGMGDSLVNLAEIARNIHDFPTALAHIKRALALYEELGFKRYISNAHLQFATTLRLSGRPSDALERLRIGFPIAKDLASPTLLADYHREFSAIAEARGDWLAAFESQRQLALATDAALDEKARQQVVMLNARYEAGRRQHEIDVLRRDHAEQASALTRARWQRYGLLVFIALGALAASAIFSRQRLKRRAERRILEETRAARAAAEEADQLKTRLLAIASHDLRNPLGNLYLLAENLREERPAGSPPDVRLDSISIESQRLLRLVEDLIETAALEIGRLELHKEKIDLAEITQAVLGEYQWQATIKHQTLAFSVPPAGTGHVEADGRRLHQVLSNLIGNAIKFTPEHKKISLHLERTATEVLLAITDEGPGLTAEDRAKIFSPFTRLSAQPSGGESSHGLGLSIASEIIRLHNGILTVESTPGHGATFTIHLPA